MASRRCLICANINPCRLHSEADQQAELARNDAAIAEIRKVRLFGVVVELYPIRPDLDPPRFVIAGPFDTRELAQEHVDKARRQNLPWKLKRIVRIVPDEA
jgi:hypothetical protein